MLKTKLLLMFLLLTPVQSTAQEIIPDQKIGFTCYLGNHIVALNEFTKYESTPKNETPVVGYEFRKIDISKDKVEKSTVVIPKELFDKNCILTNTQKIITIPATEEKKEVSKK